MNEMQPPKASASDHLANERTFLAWIRTSIALMGFGFVVVKFSLFVKQLSLAVTGQVAPTPVKGFSGVIGMCLVAIGALTALIGYLRYKRIEKQLLNAHFYPQSRLLLVLTGSVVIGSFLLLYYLLPNL
ncbi:YidH family protein [Mucilaginibacter litoreus]|uniref:YidH family protein n=2 Tax=Mucilaginibacter litoreus TaxID=1048221 RepID=A0ABW3ARC9_9SPHI